MEKDVSSKKRAGVSNADCSLNPSVRNIILEDVKRGYERGVPSNGQQSRILHSKQPENEQDSGIDFQLFSKHEGLSEMCQWQGRNCRGLGCIRCLVLGITANAAWSRGEQGIMTWKQQIN